MTLRKIRIFSFFIYTVYLILIFLFLDILFRNQTIFDLSIWDFILPGALAGIFVLFFDFQHSYYLDPSQEDEVREHLRNLGYMPTADEGNDLFFRRRKLVTWHTARLIHGEEYLILKSSENHGKYFKKGKKG